MKIFVFKSLKVCLYSFWILAIIPYIVLFPSNIQAQNTDQSRDFLNISFSSFWAAYGQNVLDLQTDGEGNLYIVGGTNPNLASETGLVTQDAWLDDGYVFFSKFDANGNLLYSTFLGDVMNDLKMVVNSNGSVVIAGRTSVNLPTLNAAQPNRIHTVGDNESIPYLIKFNPDCSVAWATFWGLDRETADLNHFSDFNLSLLNSGDVFFGATVPANLPNQWPTTPGAAQMSANREHFGIVRFLPDGNVAFSTVWGDSMSSLQNNLKLVVEESGDFYLAALLKNDAAITVSSDAAISFPPTIGNPTWQNTRDIYLARFNSLGQFLHGTYWGGSGGEHNIVTALSPKGNLILIGSTSSDDFPLTPGANQVMPRLGTGLNDRINFLVEFNSSINPIYSSYFGGSEGSVTPMELKIAKDGSIYMAGEAEIPFGGNNWQTLNAAQATFGGGLYDLALAKFSPNKTLVYSTYWGGNENDYFRGMDVFPDGSLIVTGITLSTNLQVSDGAPFSAYSGATIGGFFSSFSPNGVMDFSSYWPSSSTGFLERHDIRTKVLSQNDFFLAVNRISSPEFPTLNSHYPYSGNPQYGLTRFNCFPIFDTTNVIGPDFQNFCIGGVANVLFGNKIGGACGQLPIYQWQVSEIGASGPFEDLMDGNNANFSPSDAQTDSWYRRLVLKEVTQFGGSDSTIIDTVSISNIIFVEVNPSPAPQISFEQSTIFTCPDIPVQLNASVSGVPGNMEFNWSFGDFLSDTMVLDPIANVSETTVFTLNVQADNGCSNVAQVIVSVNPAKAGPDVTYCGGEVPVRIGSAPIAGEPAAYRWTLSNTLSCLDCPSPLASPDVTREYTLEKSLVLPNGESCMTFDEVKVYALPKNHELSDTLVGYGAPFTVGFEGSSDFNYLWSPTTFLEQADTSITLFDFNGDLPPAAVIPKFLRISRDQCFWIKEMNISVVYANAGLDKVGECDFGQLGSAQDSLPFEGTSYSWEVISGPPSFLNPEKVNSPVADFACFDQGSYDVRSVLTVEYNGILVKDTVDVFCPGCTYNQFFPGLPAYDSIVYVFVDSNGWEEDTLSCCVVMRPIIELSLYEITLFGDCPDLPLTWSNLITKIRHCIDVKNELWGHGGGGSTGYGSGEFVNFPAFGTDSYYETVALCDNFGFFINNTEVEIEQPCQSGNDFAIVNITAPLGLHLDTSYFSYEWIPSDGITRLSEGTFRIDGSNELNYQLNITFDYDVCSHTFIRSIVFFPDYPSINMDDAVSCFPGQAVTIGPAPNPNYFYEWSEIESFFDQFSARPIVAPETFPSTYQLKITDRRTGCSNSETVSVISEINQAEPSDFIVCNAAIINLGVYLDTTLENYSYLWQPSNVAWQNGTDQFSPHAQVLVAIDQAFELIVTDTLSGCFRRDSVYVEIASGNESIVMDDHVICSGDFVQIGPNDLIPGTYSWTPTNGLSCSDCPNPVASPNSSTIYNLTVDLEGDCAIFTGNVSVVVVDRNEDSITLNNINKFPLQNVELNPSIQGQCADCNYQWSPTLSLNDRNLLNPSSTISNPMSFTLSVSDEYGCINRMGTLDIIIDPPPTLPIPSIFKCPLEQVSLNPDLIGECGGCNYTWLPADGLDDPNSLNPISSIGSNMQYILVVESPDGELTYYQLIITNDFGNFIDTGDSLIVKCEGVSAEINPNLYGECSGCEYLWFPNTGLSDATIINPSTTVDAANFFYDLRVTKPDGCFDYIRIFGHTILFDSATILDPIEKCPNQTVVEINPDNLGECINCSYSWLPQEGLSNPNIINPTTNTEEGVTYVLSVFESGLCFEQYIVEIYITPDSVLDLNDLTICPFGSVDLNPDGLGSCIDCDYFWSNGNNLSSEIDVNPTAFNQGLYSLTVSTPEGCQLIGEVIVTDSEIENIGQDTIFKCAEVSIGLNPNEIGECIGCSYEWNDFIDLSDSYSVNPETSLSSGSKNYILTINDPDGCQFVYEVFVSVIPASEVPLDNILKCFNEEVELNPELVGECTDCSYEWSPSDGLDNPFSLNPISNTNVSRTYTLIITNINDGCTSEGQVGVNISAPGFIAIDNISKCPLETVELNPLLSGECVDCTYSWSPATGLSDPNILNPSTSYSGTSSISYTLTVSETNTGCISQGQVLVDALPPYNIELDTIFKVGVFNAEVNPSLAGECINCTYSWTPSSDVDDPTVLNPMTNLANSGALLLEVEDNITGCTGIGNAVVIVENPIDTIDLVLQDIEKCPGSVPEGTIELEFELTAGTWPGEIGWEIIHLDNNEIVACNNIGSAAPFQGIFSVSSGNFALVAYDEFGDGWNGAEASFFVNGQLIAGPFTLLDGGIGSGVCDISLQGDIIGTFEVGSEGFGDFPIIAELNPDSIGLCINCIYNWTPSDFLNDPLIINPTTSANENITYTINILDTITGDFYLSQVNVTVEPATELVFSPVAKCAGTIEYDVNLTLTGGTTDWMPGWELINTTTGEVVWCRQVGSAAPFDGNISLPSGSYELLAYSWDSGWSGYEANFFINGQAFAGPFTLNSGGVPNNCPGPSPGGIVIGNFHLQGSTPNSGAVAINPLSIGECVNCLYSWSPIAGLTDPNSINPITIISEAIDYTLTVLDTVTGCLSQGIVAIDINPPTTILLDTVFKIDCISRSLNDGLIGECNDCIYSWLPAINLNNENIINPATSANNNVNYELNSIDTVSGCLTVVNIPMVSNPGFPIPDAVEKCSGSILAEVVLDISGGNSWSNNRLGWEIVDATTGEVISCGQPGMESAPIEETFQLPSGNYDLRGYSNSNDWGGFSANIYVNGQLVLGPVGYSNGTNINTCGPSHNDGFIMGSFNIPGAPGNITVGEELNPNLYGQCADCIYSWAPSLGLNDSTIINPITSISEPITYGLVVWDTVSGCISTVEVDVLILEDDLSIPNVLACPFTAFQTLEFSFNGGFDINRVGWELINTDLGQVVSCGPTGTSKPLTYEIKVPPGNYELRAYSSSFSSNWANYQVEFFIEGNSIAGPAGYNSGFNPNQCAGIGSGNVILSFSIPGAVSTPLGVPINPNEIGSCLDCTYSWSPSTYLDDPSAINPKTTSITPIVYSLYTLDTISGCTGVGELSFGYNLTDDLLIFAPVNKCPGTETFELEINFSGTSGFTDWIGWELINSQSGEVVYCVAPFSNASLQYSLTVESGVYQILGYSSSWQSWGDYTMSVQVNGIQNYGPFSYDGGPNLNLCGSNNLGTLIGTLDLNGISESYAAVSLNPTLLGDCTHCVYSWSPSSFLSDSTALNPHSFAPVSTTYYFSALDTSTNCLEFGNVDVIVDNNFELIDLNNLNKCPSRSFENVRVLVDGGWSPSRVGWQIIDLDADKVVACYPPGQGAPFDQELTLLAGNYRALAYSSSWGWAGYNMEVFLEGNLIAGPSSYNGGSSFISCDDNSGFLLFDFVVPGVSNPPIGIQLNPTLEGACSDCVYNWSPSFGLDNAATINPTSTSDYDIIYTLTVIDTISGCLSRGNLEVSIEKPIEILSDLFVCPGDDIQLGAAQLPTSSTYSWSPTINLNDPNQRRPLFNSAEPGHYIFTVEETRSINGDDCVFTLAQNITVYNNPVAIVDNVHLICQGSSADIGGTAQPGLSYRWSPSLGLSCNNCSNPIASPSVSTQYLLTISDLSTSCEIGYPVQVNVFDGNNYDIFIPDYSVCRGDIIIIEPEIIPSGGNWDISWSPSLGFSNPYILEPSFSPQASQVGVQEFSLSLTDLSNGCPDISARTSIQIIEPAVFQVFWPELRCEGEPIISIPFSFSESIQEDSLSLTSSGDGWEERVSNNLWRYHLGPLDIAGQSFELQFSTFDSLCEISFSESRIYNYVGLNNLEISANIISANCDQNDGSISAYVTGGSAPFNFIWSTGSVSVNNQSDLNLLSPGVYSLTVVDDNGCSASVDMVLNEVDGPIFNVAEVNPETCSGWSDGSVVLFNPDNDVNYFDLYYSSGDYLGSYWDNEIYWMQAGNYLIRAIGNNNCESWDSFEILGSDSQPQVDISTIDFCNGEVQLIANGNGGTAPYSFQWSNGGTGPEINVSNLNQWYSVTITDNFGCENWNSIFAQQGDELFVSDQPDQTTCGLENFIMTQEVPAIGTGIWTVESGTANIQNPNNPNTTVSGIPPGQSAVLRWTVTSGSCVAFDDVTLTRFQGSINPIATANGPYCEGDNLQLSVDAPGATSISWSGPNGFSSNSISPIFPDISALDGGWYLVEVLDEFSCAGVDSVEVIVNAAPSIEPVIFSLPNCRGDGNLVLDDNGSGATNWEWTTNGNGVFVDNSLKQAVVSTGALDGDIFTLTSEGANGCTAISSIVLNEPDELLANLSIQEVSCRYASNGSAELIPSGGIFPYSINWSTGDTDSRIENLGYTNFSVTLTDENGCERILIDTIHEPDRIVIGYNLADFIRHDTSAIVLVQVNVSGGLYNETGTVRVIGLPPGYDTGDGGIVDITWEDPGRRYGLFNRSNNERAIGLVLGDTSLILNQPDSAGPADLPGNTASNLEHIIIADDREMYGVTGGGSDVSGFGIPARSFVHIDIETGAPAFISSISGTAGNGLAYDRYINTLYHVYGIGGGISIETISIPDGATIPLFMDNSLATDYPDVDFTMVTGAMHSRIADRIYVSFLSGHVAVFDVMRERIVEVVESSVITTGAVLEVGHRTQNPLCWYTSDGWIRIDTVTGGVLPYSFSWNSGGTDLLEENLPVGEHLFSVIDANGCEADQNFELRRDTMIATITRQDISCWGLDDGSFSISAQRGRAPYSYDWSNGMSGSFIEGLKCGDYTVTVTDAAGCELILQDSINEPDRLVISFWKADFIRHDTSAVVYTEIEVSEGIYTETGTFRSFGLPPGYNFGAGRIVDITSPDPGTRYGVFNRFDNQKSIGVVLGDTTSLLGQEDGATISDLPGNTIYDLQHIIVANAQNMFGVTGQATSFTPMEVKFDTTLAIADTLGKGMYFEVLHELELISLEISSFTNNISGTLRIRQNNSSGPILFSTTLNLVHSAGDSVWQSHEISIHEILSTGNYFIEIVGSSAGVFALPDAQFPYEIPYMLSIDSSNWSLGSLESIYFYFNNWRIQPQGSHPVLGPFPRSFVEIDINTLDFNVLSTLNGNPGFGSGGLAYDRWTDKIYYVYGLSGGFAIDTVSKNGQSGEIFIDITLSGQYPEVDFASLSGAMYAPVKDRIYLTFLSGHVGVFDVKKKMLVDIEESSLVLTGGVLQNGGGSVPPLCHNTFEGYAWIDTVIGGTSPYTYSWSSGGNDLEETGLGVGEFFFTVTDANGCENSRRYQLNRNPVVASIESEDVICNGEANGSAQIAATGGVGNFAYEWSDGESGQIRNNLTAGSYQITIMDGNGCPDLLNVVINQPDEINIMLPLEIEICPEDAVALEEGGTDAVSWSWSTNGNATIIDSTSRNAIALGAEAGDLFFVTITDSSFCERSESIPVVASQDCNMRAELHVRVLLQGALFQNPDTLMRNQLQIKGLLPLLDPYSAGNGGLGADTPNFEHFGSGREQWMSSEIMYQEGIAEESKPVDWIFVELRSPTDSSEIVETRVGMLNRAGYIVNPLDGVSPLVFDGFAGEAFYVSIKHRNHLGVMTAQPILLTNDLTLVDFTSMEAHDLFTKPHPIEGYSFEGLEMATLLDGRKALWAGEINQDRRVKYQGPGSDLPDLLNRVLFDLSNDDFSPNFAIAEGYHNADVNLDGLIKYSGVNNDLFLIFFNILWGISDINTENLYNYNFMLEQLPD